MQHWQPSRKQAGVAVFEVVAIIVVIALIGGAGVYIAHRHKSKTAATNSSTQSVTATPGTLQYVDQVTNNAAANETNANSSFDGQYQQAATSDNSAMNNLGGAYNESTL